jgi:hypothetical protein
MTKRRVPKLLAALGLLAAITVGGPDPAAADRTPPCGNCAPAPASPIKPCGVCSPTRGGPDDDHTMPGSGPCPSCVPAAAAAGSPSDDHTMPEGSGGCPDCRAAVQGGDTGGCSICRPR